MQMQMVRRYPPTVRARPRLCLGALICCRAAIVAEFSRQRPEEKKILTASADVYEYILCIDLIDDVPSSQLSRQRQR
jgi:hypothetical protein